MKGHIERRGPNVFLVVIEAGTDATGKRLRHFFQVKGPKRAAEAVLTTKLAELLAGTYVAPNTLTVADWLKQWLEGTARMRVTPKTLEAYTGWVNVRIIPLLGHHKLEALTGVAIQSAWAKLLKTERKDGKAGEGLSPKSIKNVHGILRAALATAVRHGVIARNPCLQVDLPRAEKNEMVVLDADQINRLLDAARGGRLWLPVLLAVTIGLRRGEVLALRWADVDFEAGTVMIAQSVEQTRAGLRMKEPKSGRPRRVVMPQILHDELRAHRVAQLARSMQDEECHGRARLGQAGHGLAGRGEAGQGLVVCDQDGKPLSPSGVTQAFRTLVLTVDGVPAIRYHDLRHSCASLLLSLGVPLPVVSEVLGHADTSITARVYSHALQSSRVEAAERMNDALRRAQGE